MADRSLRTVVTDGFTARRYVHHLVKLATGAVCLAAYALALHALPVWLAGVLCSGAWFLTIRIAYALDHGTPIVKPDLWCDLALHGLPIAAYLAWRPETRGVGSVLAVVLSVAYGRTYPDAEP